ncbi:MAG TPA: hypothetical protein VGS23_06385 [Thermoplasmata archaeon]|nr:hypothetical protein [Thermoplasmata archaeon]
MASTPREDPPPWASVSDLSEYAFCPRAQWYRHHPPEAPADEAAVRSARLGEVYHHRALSRVRHREERTAPLALLALAAATLILLGLFLSGAL